MALQNHPALYTGGNERLNSRPHTMLYAQLMQRKQAKDDAYDEYVRNLNKNINPAGLRNVDRPAFEQKLKEWQQYGMQNKEVLRNPRKDNGGASIEFQARYQDLVNLISESKQEEEKKKPLVEIMTDPAKRDRLNESELFPKIASHDQPLFTQDQKTGQWVRDGQRRSFNVADLDFDPKPFEQDKFFKGLDDVKPSQSTEVRTKNKDLTNTVVTTAVFGGKDKDVIASRAVAEYGQNKAFKTFVDQLDPSEYNDIFKDSFGHDIENPGDLAAAYALKGKQQQHTTQKIVDDKMAQWKVQEAIRQANREKNMRRANDYILSRDSFRRSQNAKVVDEYVNSQFNDPNAKGVIVTNDGNKFEGKLVKAPKVLVDKYSVWGKDDEKNDILQTPEFVMTSDKKYVIPVYKKGKKTKSGWDAVDSQRIPIADWKIQISNDWIKSNRTAGELADEFDVEDEVSESGSSTNIIRKSAPVRGILD